MLWMYNDKKNPYLNVLSPYPDGNISSTRNETYPSITGSTETDKLANVYDTKGGIREWTMEAHTLWYRALRGGDYLHNYSPSAMSEEYPSREYADLRL